MMRLRRLAEKPEFSRGRVGSPALRVRDQCIDDYNEQVSDGVSNGYERSMNAAICARVTAASGQ